MSDLGRYLPLSQGRGGDDEARVSDDWSLHVADCLDAIATLLADLGPDDWNVLVGPDGFRLPAAVHHLVDRSAAALRAPVTDAARSIVMNDLSGFVAIEWLARMAPGQSATLVRSVRQVATEMRVPPVEPSGFARWAGRSKIRRESLRVLTDVVVTGYDIGAETGRDPAFPAVATGAVALARIGTAPGAIRAVARGRTIRADDADWSFGRGPVLAGSASSIIRFLFGRAGVPGSGPSTLT